jgi:hypothetical protein
MGILYIGQTGRSWNVAILFKIHFTRMMRSLCRWGSFYGVYGVLAIHWVEVQYYLSRKSLRWNCNAICNYIEDLRFLLNYSLKIASWKPKHVAAVFFSLIIFCVIKLCQTVKLYISVNYCEHNRYASPENYCVLNLQIGQISHLGSSLPWTVAFRAKTIEIFRR